MTLKSYNDGDFYIHMELNEETFEVTTTVSYMEIFKFVKRRVKKEYHYKFLELAKAYEDFEKFIWSWF